MARLSATLRVVVPVVRSGRLFGSMMAYRRRPVVRAAHRP